MTWLSALAVCAVLAALTLLHQAFWSWRLRAPAREDELVFAQARDGWRLALGRCRPAGPPRPLPVLLVHGIAMNRQTFELDLPRYSLAAHLAAAGFDCFSLDLRGHGASSHRGRGAPRRWNLDTYLLEDLPAAFEAIRRETGAVRVLYVGHSQGALLGLAAAGVHHERIAAVAALAAPVHFDRQQWMRKLVGLHFPFRSLLTRPLARMVAPFAGFWYPPLANLAVNHRNVERRVVRRVLANAVENVPVGVLEQYRVFIQEDSFRSMDGTVDYRASMASCRQPALFVAAERDGLAPPPVVEAAFREWGGPKRYRIFERDYGHSDLLFGRRAPEEVYPVVREFLEQATGPARA
jgi:pimeloyl-ACP methyl ester carboxylesterase